MPVYTPTQWKNSPSTETPISAANLNKIEQGIYENSTALEALPNFDDFVREDELPNFSEFALASDIPDITPLATKAELVPLASTAAVEDMIADIPPPDLSSYATQDYVTNAINQAVIDGSDTPVDLSAYALKTEVENKVDKVLGKGLSTNDYTNVEKTKLAGIESGAQKNPDLSNYATLDDIPLSTQIELNGEIITGLRRYVYDVTATDGSWEVDYSDKNFTKFVNVYFYSIAVGTGTSDRTIPTLRQGQPTLTGCTGYLMSATSAGLLAAMTLVNASGPVRVLVEGV